MAEESTSKTTLTFQAYELVDGNLMPLNYGQLGLVLDALGEITIPVKVDGIGNIGLVLLNGRFESHAEEESDGLYFLDYDNPLYDSDDLLTTIDATGIEDIAVFWHILTKNDIHTVNDLRNVLKTIQNSELLTASISDGLYPLVELLHRYYDQRGLKP